MRTSTMSSLDLEPYQHKALQPGQVRILLIKWEKSSDDLVCGIYHGFPYQVPYNAISYAWEPASTQDERVNIPLFEIIKFQVDNDPIVHAADGQPYEPEPDDRFLRFADSPSRSLSVTKPMWKMLLSVRFGIHDTEDDQALLCPVWIDQICIDQSNNSEKSEQVRMMHKIYGSATCTIIYLGEPSETTHIAFEAAYALAALATLDEEEIPFEGERQYRKLDWFAIRSIPTYTQRYYDFATYFKSKPQGMMDIQPYQEFARDVLGRRWFNRTWVIQEAVCSPKIVIKIGNFTIPWEYCVAGCRIATKLELTQEWLGHGVTESLADLEQLRQHYQNVRVYLSASTSDKPDDETIQSVFRSLWARSIPCILPRSMSKEATEPRDKVFAMLNIISEPAWDDFGLEISTFIDYDLPVRIVYLRACEIWFTGSSSRFSIQLLGRSARKLSFLDIVHNTTGDNGYNLPSWVPDWTQKSFFTVVTHTSWRAALSQDDDEDSAKCHVGFPSVDQYQLNEVPLGVRGLVLFSIQRICKTVRDLDFLQDHANAISQFSDPCPTTNLSYSEVYHMALMPENSQFASSNIPRSGFWDFSKQIPGDKYDQNQARQTPLTIDKSTLPRMILLAFCCPAKCLAYERPFFISMNGFIGLAPETAEEGDEVVLLFGGRSPYVVRRLLCGRYRFIGACYPLGLMSGEALNGYPEDKVRDFILV
jgi:hypothetical protein